MLQSLVESSNVSRIGWHNGTLYVQFTKTGIYAYNDVDIKHYNVMLQPGTSVGKYLNSDVKPFHTYQKVEEDVFTTL